ncbi:cytochrome c oxidase copper chaperone isoform X2 [Pongo abelii]|uniref:COX17 isoform 4 n=1 Tax=Pongo abelii TaxID=9601 RepID=A0A2J8W271_PONAB|nr:cytochrome c oxidase copper chaperone isoform X2 [Pongo abelii]PNJ63881.1 COX17 isoform 4 [Pongo abelii]
MPGLVDSNPAPPESQEKKPLKPCCACPETKKARDAWFRGLVSVDLSRSLVPGNDGDGGERQASTTHSFLQIIIEKGEEHCGHLIEAHKECMRALGFKI